MIVLRWIVYAVYLPFALLLLVIVIPAYYIAAKTREAWEVAEVFWRVVGSAERRRHGP